MIKIPAELLGYRNKLCSYILCLYVLRVQTNGVVTSICSQLMNDTICSLSGSSATDLWRLQHIYQLHTSMGLLRLVIFLNKAFVILICHNVLDHWPLRYLSFFPLAVCPYCYN